MRVLADTANRVADHTADRVNAQIRRATDESIAYHRAHPEEIEARLAALDREWDVERALETGSSLLSLTGLALGLKVSRKWLLLPLVVQSFFLQHALQGWCPPLPVFRRLGFRTPKEIERERHALRALLGKPAARTKTGRSAASPVRIAAARAQS